MSAHTMNVMCPKTDVGLCPPAAASSTKAAHPPSPPLPDLPLHNPNLSVSETRRPSSHCLTMCFTPFPYFFQIPKCFTTRAVWKVRVSRIMLSEFAGLCGSSPHSCLPPPLAHLRDPSLRLQGYNRPKKKEGKSKFPSLRKTLHFSFGRATREGGYTIGIRTGIKGGLVVIVAQFRPRPGGLLT